MRARPHELRKIVWGSAVALLCVGPLIPRFSAAQAVSAVRGAERAIADENERQLLQIARDAKAAAIAGRAAVAGLQAKDIEKRNEADAFLKGIEDLSTEALDSRLPWADREQAARILTRVTADATSQGALPGFSVRSVPQVFKAYSDISFVLGLGATLRTGTPTQSDVDLETNVVGAVLGSGLGAIGSEGLKKYVQDNFSTAAALPISREGHVQPVIGLGLGFRDIKSLRVWPVLEMAQVDTSDAFVPRAIVRLKPAETRWSSPAVSIAVPLWLHGNWDSDFDKRGMPDLIASVSVITPVYFPGGPFEAITALFSDDAKKYERHGSVGWRIGIHVPLRIVKETTSK